MIREMLHISTTLRAFPFNFNFNSVQLALVLEDYEPPALRVQGFVSRKKGARSMVEEKKEGKNKK